MAWCADGRFSVLALPVNGARRGAHRCRAAVCVGPRRRSVAGGAQAHRFRRDRRGADRSRGSRLGLRCARGEHHHQQPLFSRMAAAHHPLSCFWEPALRETVSRACRTGFRHRLQHAWAGLQCLRPTTDLLRLSETNRRRAARLGMRHDCGGNEHGTGQRDQQLSHVTSSPEFSGPEGHRR